MYEINKIDFQKYSFVLLPLRHSKKLELVYLVKEKIDILDQTKENMTNDNKVIFEKFKRKTYYDFNQLLKK